MDSVVQGVKFYLQKSNASNIWSERSSDPMASTFLTKSSVALSKLEVNWDHCSHDLAKARWKSRTRGSSLLGKEERKPFLGRLVVLIPLKVLRQKASSAPGAELETVMWEVGSSVPLGTCHHLLCFSQNLKNPSWVLLHYLRLLLQWEKVDYSH